MVASGRVRLLLVAFGRLEGNLLSQRRNFASRRWYYKKALREASKLLQSSFFKESFSLLATTVEEDFESSFKTSAILRGELCFSSSQTPYETASREASRKLVPQLSILFLQGKLIFLQRCWKQTSSREAVTRQDFGGRSFCAR